MLTVGIVVTIKVCDAVAVHEFESVPVTAKIVVVNGVNCMDDVVTPLVQL